MITHNTILGRDIAQALFTVTIDHQHSVEINKSKQTINYKCMFVIKLMSVVSLG